MKILIILSVLFNGSISQNIYKDQNVNEKIIENDHTNSKNNDLILLQENNPLDNKTYYEKLYLSNYPINFFLLKPLGL
jgi:hypothetical protein